MSPTSPQSVANLGVIAHPSDLNSCPKTHLKSIQADSKSSPQKIVSEIPSSIEHPHDWDSESELFDEEVAAATGSFNEKECKAVNSDSLSPAHHKFDDEATSVTDFSEEESADASFLQRDDKVLSTPIKNIPQIRPDSPVLGPVEFFRKATVGAAGVAMIGVGAVLVPVPLPIGVPTIAAGMAVLNYEFPETTKKAMNGAKDRIVSVLETEEDDDEEDSTETDNGSKRRTKSVFKKQAEKLGKRVLPWMRKEKVDPEQPDSKNYESECVQWYKAT
mmetsp:Transcript_16/g.55  ORF Transcript_16/g.55 Transcript_16/m.55 type:complete len:275 (-) Transcript_16:284-1108(-)|eukprot:CAMPEP_0195525146 /NCGR_PEP_ID=MMETSP0794_2-20130614/25420_1 /TAXON_ID=515487 /ORGANISM="Stephanopyxis turris, Strain CCMP 815" /LENGTH=274 /DNA_ID=CAMNT_0040655527 /DNA_START=154 /DNA_END=978 /DNA_ORIENTATION=-